MKSILVPVEGSDLLNSILATAVLLGRPFGSYFEGLPLSAAISSFVAGDLGNTVFYEVQTERDDEIARDTRRTFDAYMHQHELATGPAGVRTSSGWREGAPVGDNFVGSYARVFDATVVGRPGSNGARMSTLEAALFESGRPILIAPPVPPARLGETVLIAWNGSTETARAIAFALPVLKNATRVVVLTVEGSTTQGPSGDQVVRHLERNGISSEAVSVARGRQSPGELILSHAAEIGADLIVKGAYTQSRLRQMIFGGATRHIISEATLPVFMAH